MIAKQICLSSLKLSTAILICFLTARPLSTDAAPPTLTAEQMIQAAEIRSGSSGGALYAGPMIESTGFEASDGWAPRDGVNNGFICGPEFADCSNPDPLACPDPGGNCCFDDPNPDTGWYISTTSMHCTEPHIDTVNPATGTQHLRFQRAASNADGHYGDTPGCVGFAGACRVSAFTPLAVGDGALAVGPTTTEMDIYASATFNSQFTLFEVAEASGNSIAGYTYFAYWGYIYSYQPGVVFHPLGSWSAGAYQHLQVRHDPCDNTFTVNYGGVDLYSHSMDNMGLWVSRVIMQTDNAGEVWDVDNFAITREGECPHTCGADGIEIVEQCDFGVDEDANCPGRCVLPGEVGPNGESECTCAFDICDLGLCCATDLPNGTTEYTTHGGRFTFVADAPATAIETCGSEGFDSYLVVYTNSDGSDDCSDETGLDVVLTRIGNCFGCGIDSCADPLASCYSNIPTGGACTCFPTTIGQRYWVWELQGGGVLGGHIVITKSKRLTCDAIWENGACCDGVTGICEDEVPPDQCTEEFQTFTLNNFCNYITCETAIGACCDASPGLGGTCTDDIVYADCTGEYKTWSANTLCSELVCEEVIGACCDRLDGFCSVTLRDDCTAAHPNGPVWTAATSCNDVLCDPALGACCNTRFGTCTADVTLAECTGLHLNWTKQDSCNAQTCPDPFIPTVSQWGLLVTTLLLLIAAKVYFGRQTAIKA